LVKAVPTTRRDRPTHLFSVPTTVFPKVGGEPKNVTQAPDGGLVADLHILKSHPLAESIFEAAERRPETFGLSHDATGTIKRQNGENVVVRIDAVHAVDIVSDPASTRSLSESRSGQPATATVAEFVKRLREEEALAAGGMIDNPSGTKPGEKRDGPDETRIKKAYRDAVESVLDSHDLSPSEKKSRIGKLIDARADSLLVADDVRVSIEAAVGGAEEAKKILGTSGVQESRRRLSRLRRQGPENTSESFARRLQGRPPVDDVGTFVRRLRGGW
jgi:hypothetical protein